MAIKIKVVQQVNVDLFKCPGHLNIPNSLSILFLDISMYSGFNSIKMAVRFNDLATIPVVPAPAKGSRTIPFSGQPALIQGSIKSGGKVAK